MDTGPLTVARVMSQALVVVDLEESPLPADRRRPHTTPGTPLAEAVAGAIGVIGKDHRLDPRR
jgi:hypothetical protein